MMHDQMQLMELVHRITLYNMSVETENLYKLNRSKTVGNTEYNPRTEILGLKLNHWPTSSTASLAH
jgi:hypothetical protein